VNKFVDVGAVVLFFAVINFMVTYHLIAPWWRQAIGQNIMSWSAITGALLGLRMLTLIFGSGYPGEQLLRGLGFVTFAAVVYWRLALLVRAQLSTEAP